MILVIGCAAAAALFVLAVVLDSRATKRTLASEPAATPPSLYPKINTDVCICAGACVTACPEGDVIGIVDGRPRLIKPSACVGHADCLRSCPVDAIELVLGSAEQAVEVPVASGTFETSVAGLYVAGEVTGVGLIHNAVAQGRQVAAAALTGIPRDHGLDVDVVIVGAGPAGLAAALEARRRGVRFVVFERDTMGGAIRSYPRHKIVMTSPLDLPGFGKVKLRRTSKEALVELFESIVELGALPIVERANVTAIQATRDGFRVETSAGPATAPRVILAIGRRGAPRRLGVPGEDLPHVVVGVTEPERYAGERVVVVGGGNSAAELAVALSRAGARVSLVHRGKDLGRCKPENRHAVEVERATGRLAVAFAASVFAITPDRVELVDGRSIEASLVVCCLGAELPGQWLRSIGISLRELRGEPLMALSGSRLLL